MRGKILSLALVTMLATIIAGCNSGSSDSAPATNPNVAAFPAAADSFEGAGGDNTVATASTAAIGTSQSRTIFPVGDVDYIKVNLVAGTEYEFSANHLSVNSDSEMYLYAADGTTQLGYNDDIGDDYAGIYYDSAIRYTPAADETVYVQVRHLYSPNGVLRYTFNAHAFVDVDGDDYSTYYDCNDNNAGIAPWEIDIPGDGIDQDCSGADVIRDDVADASEPDETPAQAKTLMAAEHFVGEVIFMGDIERANMRTIYPAADVDWFKVTVPAHSAVGFDFGNYLYSSWGWMDDGLAFEPTYEAYTAEILTNPGAPTVTSDFYENTTATDETLYLKYEDSGNGDPTGVYIPVVWSYGTDKDGDGYYTRGLAYANYDCNDNDANIYTGAPETDGDGIDSNCDGADNN